MDLVNYKNDCLYEILMRVDPVDMANCILVSKDWLQVITGPDFRTKYLSRWKGNLVVGLLVFDISPRSPTLMLPTTGLGRQLNENTLIPETSRIGSFVSKSPNSSHMLFISRVYSFPLNTHTVVHTAILYVWTGGPAVGAPLPPPPVHYRRCKANILSDEADANSYKVILANYESQPREKNALRIQIFSSRTSKWEQSVLTCSASLTIYPLHGSGTVTRDGVIYWKARSHDLDCLAAWDMKGGNSSISLIIESAAPSGS